MTFRFATVAFAAALLAGCAGGENAPAQVGANPYPPVPQPIAEPIPKPPVSPVPLLWQPGHWNWNGTGYTWEPGQYVPAAGHGPLFQPGYWAHTPSGWTWRPAHWTS
jgi:hypothetical protein